MKAVVFLRQFSLKHGKTLACVGTASALFLTGLLLNICLFNFGMKREREWLNYEKTELTESEAQKRAERINTTPEVRQRMVEQLLLLQARIRTHAKVLSLFYTLNLVSSTTIALFSGFATISLFFISKSGWDKARHTVTAVFVTSSGILFFYINVSLILKFQDNSNLNGQLYSEYAALGASMLTYWAIHSNDPNQKSPEDLVLYIDSELARLGAISLDFDASRITEAHQPLNVFD